MELKVWCDGIQRVVCGATTTTTCQDIVFALAHATGQTGRFILIEKWRNSERILAPVDRPLASLAKWGEYSNDVTFLMKRSGDVSGQARIPHKTSLNLNKKSDSELIHQRKELINSFMNSSQDKKNHDNSNISSSMVKSHSSIDHSLQHSSTLPPRNKAEPFVRSISFQVNSGEQFEASSRFSENEGVKYRLDRSAVDNENYGHLPLKSTMTIEPPNKIPFQNLNEPFYSTLSKSKKHRPRQPPPYQEAIAKSTLVNIINTNSEPPNSIYGTTTSLQRNVPSSQYGHNGHNQMYGNSSLQERKYNKKNSEPALQPSFNSAIVSHSQNNSKSMSSIHNETISLIDIQQKTMKNQERDVVNIEKEINMVENKLSENEFIVKRYKDEMELLKQLWHEQEMLIEKFESENIQDELDRLICDEKKYENDLIEIKQKLANCENEVANCRDEICKLMNKIDESCNTRSNQKENNFDDNCTIEHLRASILEKNKEIESQKNEISSLSISIEHLDKSIQEKNELMDSLVIEIKDANVEGLSLQSAALFVEERESVNSDQSTPRSGTNRKIPVSPHELGKTVPTKKNPDGIWV